ncbi:hypothetical protein K439DRAFT_677154 [Ramaria rubella]|nr:hypothetical protein K439DRAFT_677154 [Ramaria rubella]
MKIRLPQSHLEAPQPQTNIIYCKLADLTSMCPAYEQRLKDCGAGPHSSKPHGDEICSRLCPPQRTGDNITIAEFVRQYGLNTEIERMLEQEGYHRMHAVKGIDVKDLPDMGFKKGHIAELKAAIDKWAKM